MQVADEIKVIDVDSHMLEPRDLWTSRLGRKWGEDRVPHVRFDPDTGDEAWWIGDEKWLTVGVVAMSGFDQYWPAHPATYADIAETAIMDAKARLEKLDEFGIHAQLFYPNVGGFGSGCYTKLGDPELMLDCLRVYNDYAVEWASADPNRLIPVMAVPLWDVELAVEEMRRCVPLGHRGIIMSSLPEQFDEPMLADPYWNPLWQAAQEMSVPINFHVSGGDPSFRSSGFAGNGTAASFAKLSSTSFTSSINAIAELILSGMCHRYPGVNFVVVESGVGWVPYLLSSLDWQWVNSGTFKEHPEYDLLPSEYFRRQIYATFWFEGETTKYAMDVLGADNLMFETDYSHPTSMSPGPASGAENPRDFLEDSFAGVDRTTLKKVLHDNAARLYNLA